MTAIQFLLAVSFATILAAPSKAAAKNLDTYTYLTISDADSMDPAWSYDTASDMVILNVYEPLVMFDKTSTEKLVPILSEKVPSKQNGLISPDGKTYTFPIRHGVKFHDGVPLAAEDVKYSLQRFMLLDRAAGPSPLLLAPLTGHDSTRDEHGNLVPGIWEAVNRAVSVQGDKVILRLPRPYAPLLSILASWSPTVSKAWAVKNGDWDGSETTWTKFNNPSKETSPFFERANGTGPFKLDRWDRKTKEFILTRNDHYWRKPAKLKTVVVKGVNEFGTRKLMLEAGDADAIYADRPLLSQLQNLPGVQIIDNLPTVEMNPVLFFTFKLNSVGNPYIGSGKLDGDGISSDFFSDINVRKGFAYAFDYKGFVSDVMRGKGTQAHGAIPESLPGYNPRQATYGLDLEKAAAYFKKAQGGKLWDTGFRFTIAFNSGNLPRQTVCQIIKRNVESLNPKFKIDVRAVEWPTFLDAYKSSKLPIFIMGWVADYPDPHNFMFTFLHSRGDYPTTQHFRNPELDRLVEEGETETNTDKRKALYAKAQAIEFEQCPHLVILDTVLYRTQRSWVKGWYDNPIFPDAPYGGYFYPLWKE